MHIDILSGQFKLLSFLVYCVICDILEGDDRLTQGIECFRQMQNELPEDTGSHNERAQWELGKVLQPRHKQS